MSCGRTHKFHVFFHCHSCGKKFERTFSRQCRAAEGYDIEKKKVGCKTCHKPAKEGFLMYLSCTPGGKDHDYFWWNEHKVEINIDNLDNE